MRYINFLFIMFLIILFHEAFAERAVCYSHGKKIYDHPIKDSYYGINEYTNSLWLVEKNRTVFVYNADCVIYMKNENKK